METIRNRKYGVFIATGVIESIFEKLYKEIIGPDGFIGKFYNICKEDIALIWKLFQRIEKFIFQG